MAPARQPFVATVACAEQLASHGRQVTDQLKLVNDYIDLAERNHNLEAEMAELKEALRQKSAAQAAEKTLLKNKVERLQSSNARLQSELDAELSKNEALKAELQDADLDMEDLREEYSGNLYKVREAYKEAQRDCAQQLKAAEEQRLGLEQRLHTLTATAQDPSQDKVAAEDAWLHAACASLIKQASTASAGQPAAPAPAEHVLYEDAKPSIPAPAEHVLYEDAQPSIPAPAEHVLYEEARPSIPAPAEHVLYEDAKPTIPAPAEHVLYEEAQPTIPAPADLVLYEEAAAAPAIQAGKAASKPLGPDSLLEAEPGCCLQLHTLAEEYVMVSIIWAAC